MATLALNKREKFTVYLIASLLALAGAMYFGEQFQPFKIVGDIGSYAMAKVSGTSVRSSTRAKMPTTTASMYTVKKGDTIWGISKKFGVHPEALEFANYLSNDGKIIVGQKLAIPRKG
jgi:LysM repeat protein